MARCEADHSPPSSAKVKECADLYLLSPNMPLWHGAQFKKKHGDNFILSYSRIQKFSIIDMKASHNI